MASYWNLSAFGSTVAWILITVVLVLQNVQTGSTCSLMPVKEGGRVIQTMGVVKQKSSSIGHCIAQCYKLEECTGVNYLRLDGICEKLYQKVDTNTMVTHNSSIHVTMIRGITPGTVRLMGGYSDQDGRVEMHLNDTWGTICDERWDDTDAEVVCRQLGLCGGKARLGDSYPQGVGDIYRHHVACNGSEESLLDCHGSFGPGSCTHAQDAGVLCTSCNIRLVDGKTPLEGRLEVYMNGSFGTICDDNWDNTDATVVCKELGYCTGKAKTGAFFGPGTGPIHLDNVACTGKEESVLDCPAIKEHNCQHNEDSGVECMFEFPCLRLADGKNIREGRVEVFQDNKWGTICDDKWDDLDAVVVCQQLGFCGGIAKTKGFFGPGKNEILLDDVQCTGKELNLLSCPRKGSRHNCGHKEDAAVICSECKN